MPWVSRKRHCMEYPQSSRWQLSSLISAGEPRLGTSTSSATSNSSWDERIVREPVLMSGTSRRPWTTVEDRALVGAIAKYGSSSDPGTAWSAISGEVGGGRTNKDCRKRWFQTLDPSLRKGRWTPEEDSILREAFAEFGPQWKEMASRVPGRTDAQVAKRWKDVLSPGLTLDAPWSPEEDDRLLKLFDEYGPKWTLMSDNFPGRNGIACRNRFRRFRNSRREFTVEQLSEATTPTDVDTTNALARPDSGQSPGVFAQTEHFPFSIEPGLTLTQPSAQSHLLGSWFSQTPAWELADTSDRPTVDAAPPDVDSSHALPMEDWLADTSFHTDLWSHPQPEPLVNVPLDTLSPQSSSRSTNEPICNSWALLMALESGSETLTLSAELVRRLLSDASRSSS